jgi:hypothetical protein
MSRSVAPGTYRLWLRSTGTAGLHIGLAAELDDSFGHHVGVPLLVVGVLRELGGDGRPGRALSGEVVALMPGSAYQFGRQDVVEDLGDV